MAKFLRFLSLQTVPSARFIQLVWYALLLWQTYRLIYMATVLLGTAQRLDQHLTYLMISALPELVGIVIYTALAKILLTTAQKLLSPEGKEGASE